MKIFAASDIHSYFTPFKKALDDAGFEVGNPEHLFVGCGDYFDRGEESQQVLDYLLAIPNKVLVKGNHEKLMEDMIKRKEPSYYDWRNRTAKTAIDLTGEAEDWGIICERASTKLKPLYDSMVKYFETEHYIFVHARTPSRDWRIAGTKRWEDAAWDNPFTWVLNGGNKTGKTVVHGHWHNSYYWSSIGVGSEFDNDACFDICEHNGCIGLDTCTCISGKVNILVVEDNLIECKNGN